MIATVICTLSSSPDSAKLETQGSLKILEPMALPHSSALCRGDIVRNCLLLPIRAPERREGAQRPKETYCHCIWSLPLLARLRLERGTNKQPFDPNSPFNGTLFDPAVAPGESIVATSCLSLNLKVGRRYLLWTNGLLSVGMSASWL